MDPTRFDSFIRAVGHSEQRAPSRRGLLALFGGGLIAGLAPALAAEARRKKKHKKHKRRRGGGGGGGGGNLGLREICDPGQPACQAGLACDTPTTRHTCSSTVEGVDTWCCVPPGGTCTECDCCGDYYCAFDDDNNPTCQPNPEG
jgi:hypothetical protein